jgi:hypothetical protein
VRSTYCQPALQQVSHEGDLARCVAFALLNDMKEVAVSAVARVGFVVIAPILGACALSAPPLPSLGACPHSSEVVTGFHDHTLSPADTSVVVTHPDNGSESVPGRGVKGAPDFYGNEVSDAVARFELDETGDLYEVHSPQTELPSLPSPTS